MVLLIDGLDIVSRSNFSIDGSILSLIKLREGFPECQFVIVWDNGERRKKDVFSQHKYKKFDLNSIMSDIKKCFSGLKIQQIESLFEEARNVIASYVHKMGNDLIYIYSSDKFLLQLIKDGRVILIRPKTPTNPERIIDEEAAKTFFGVSPSDIAFFLAFRGSSGDHFPGIHFVSSSLIAHLVRKYHTLDGIYANLQKECLTDFQLKSFKMFRSQVLVNYQLIQLNKGINFCARSLGTISDTQEILDKYDIKSFSSTFLDSALSFTEPFIKKSTPMIAHPLL